MEHLRSWVELPGYNAGAMKFSRNYLYFRRHFGSLASRFGGRMVVISGGRVVGSVPRNRGRDLARIVDRARVALPREVPFVSPIPRVKELAHPLFL